MNAYVIYIDEDPGASTTPWRMYSVPGVAQIKHDDRVVSLYREGLEQHLTLIGVVKLSENTSVVLADEPPQLGGLTEAPMHEVPQRPVVTSIAPAIGRKAGGDVVEIQGDQLLDASNVFFGATPATSFTVAGPNGPIHATAPPGADTAHVTVVTPGGTSAMTSADQFTYQDPGPPPRIHTIIPDTGITTGGETIVVLVQSQSGLKPQVTGLLFASVPSPSVVEDPTYPVSVSAWHAYKVVTPPNVAGSAALTLLSTEGSFHSLIPFTYTAPPAPQPPAVTSVSKSIGPTIGGTAVRIAGTGLGDATAVHFGSVPAQSFDVTMDESKAIVIDAVTPPNQGAVPITVTTPRGVSSAVGAPTFESQPPRSLSSVAFGNQAVGTASAPRTAPFPLMVSLSDFPPNQVVPYSGGNPSVSATFLLAGIGPTFTVGQLMAAFGDMSLTYSIIGFSLDRAAGSDFALQDGAGPGTIDVLFKPVESGYRADVVRANVGGVHVSGGGLVGAIAGAIAPSFVPVLRSYLGVLLEGTGV